jgi:hypothetical protein
MAATGKARQTQLKVYSLDYWDPADRAGIRDINAIQRAHGFMPYVGTSTLTKIIPELAPLTPDAGIIAGQLQCPETIKFLMVFFGGSIWAPQLHPKRTLNSRRDHDTDFRRIAAVELRAMHMWCAGAGIQPDTAPRGSAA